MLPPEAILQQGSNSSLAPSPGERGVRRTIPTSHSVVLTFSDTTAPQHVDEPGADVLEPSRSALFETIFKSSLDGILLLEAATGLIQLLNPAAEQLLGYAEGQLKGQPFAKLLTDEAEQGANGAVHFGPVFAGQPFLTADGRELKLDLTATELPVTGDTPLIMVTLRDAAARINAETVLRNSQERYRTIVEDQTEMIVRWKPGGEITFANGAFRRARGLSEGEAEHSWDFTELRPDSDAYTGSCSRPVATPGSPISVREFRRESAAGQVVWERWLDRALFSPAGELVEFQSVGRDTTSRKMLEMVLERERSSLAQRVAQRTAELTASNQELARASRAKDEFLAQVSNELRAPLQSIIEMAGALAAPANDGQPDSVQNRATAIKESGQELLGTIDNLIEISRIDAGKLDLQHAPFHLTMVCEAALARVSAQARHKRITISHDIPVDIPAITGDAPRVREMLLNLLRNGVQLTPEGGELGLNVHLAGSARDCVAIDVWHSGSGMRTEELRRIFVPTAQGERAAEQPPGAGLGLVLTSRLAMAHGGSMCVETCDKRGTRFRLRLPVRAPGASSGASEEPEPFEEGGYGSAPTGKTVLIADACEHQRRQLEGILRAQGHTVVQVASGVEAVDAARARMVDLLICADPLPAMDGWQVAQALGESFAFSSIPVILLQGLALPDETAMATHQNIAALFPKPVDAPQLLESVRSLLV